MRRGDVTTPEEREREHALRNAWNVVELSVSLARSTFDEGDEARAIDFLARAEKACAQCRTLLAAAEENAASEAPDRD